MAEIMERLMNAGFAVAVNAAHDELFVRLQNRQVSTMEVWTALDFEIEQSRLSRQGDAVVVKE